MSLARLLFTALVMLCAVGAHARTVVGPSGSGGGDECENRFKQIAGDLQGWLKNGGGEKLGPILATQRLTVDEYRKAMATPLANFQIKCVGPGDEGYPVEIGNSPKECVNWVDEQGINRIKCDLQKFYTDRPARDNDPGQYMIVHHEFASLAGIESPNVDDSNYFVSAVITDSLRETLVWKLAILPEESRTLDGFEMPASATEAECAQEIVKVGIALSPVSDVRVTALDLHPAAAPLFLNSLFGLTPYRPAGYEFAGKDSLGNSFSGVVDPLLKDSSREDARSGVRTAYKICRPKAQACTTDPQYGFALFNSAGTVLYSAETSAEQCSVGRRAYFHRLL